MAIAAQSFAPEQFLHPLDVIRSEHDRQLLVCDRLVELAKDFQLEPVAEEAETLLAYLTEQLSLHDKDEDDDLFRLMKLRCHPDDGFDRILAQLKFEHKLDKVLAHFIAIDLKKLTGRRGPEPPMRLFMDLRTFTEAQRRHIAWENSVVLPLARKRLTAEDLETMGRNMAARRGIAYPGRRRQSAGSHESYAP